MDWGNVYFCARVIQAWNASLFAIESNCRCLLWVSEVQFVLLYVQQLFSAVLWDVTDGFEGFLSRSTHVYEAKHWNSVNNRVVKHLVVIVSSPSKQSMTSQRTAGNSCCNSTLTFAQTVPSPSERKIEIVLIMIMITIRMIKNYNYVSEERD